MLTRKLAGNASVQAGHTFNGPVPPPSPIDPTLAGGLGFTHPIDADQQPNLTAVVAIEIISSELLGPSWKMALACSNR